MPKIEVGDFVEFNDSDLHNRIPDHYPPVGTIGEVDTVEYTGFGLLVRWIGWGNIYSRWYCDRDAVKKIEV